LVVEAAVRDLRTDDDTTLVLEEAQLTAVLDPDHVIRDLSHVPSAAASALTATRVGPGFRSLVRDRVPAEARTPVLDLLFDDLPMAVLLSGFEYVYSGGDWKDRVEPGILRPDVCSGWRSDGTMMTMIDQTGVLTLPGGPDADPLDGGDAGGWHTLPALTPGAIRRQRLLDVGRGTPRLVCAHLRDSHCGDDARSTVLHEWSVQATYDATTDQFDTVRATPQVLPWDECPAAADSARRLSGASTDEVRRMLRSEFSGVSTCTHLTELLRSLSAVADLVARAH
jgi:hypothetical protein